MRSEPERQIRPRWAPRLPPHKLRRLYEGIGQGIVDEELLDDVGYRLFARCQSILVVRDFVQKKVLPCAACGATVLLGPEWNESDPNYPLTCSACGWNLPWGAYWATFRHQELGPGGAVDIFEDFVREWAVARLPREKILAIDRVIHRWHWETAVAEHTFGLGRPSGINLIEGNRGSVIAFLDELTYGPATPPEVMAARESWRAGLQQVQGRLAEWHRRKASL
jgi:hypothetical protein